MRTLGYTYNRSAANLRRRTSEAVGLIINDIRNPFFAEMVSGTQQVFDERGLLIYLVESGNDLGRQERLLQSLIEHGIGGVIVCAATDTNTNTEFVRRLIDLNLKVCLVVRRLDAPVFDFVGADNYEAARLATTHLLDLGHRRIAFLGGEARNPVQIDRLAGYFSALCSRGIPFDPDLCTDGASDRSATFDVVHILENPQRPTAALAHNDRFAINAMAALRERAIEPGRDFSLVGFDGTPSAEVCYPSLTTVSLHPFEIGRQAATYVFERIKDPTRPPQFTNLRPTLVKRMSTQKAPD